MDEFVLKGGLVHRGDGSEPQEIDISVKKGKILGFLKATKKNSKNVIDVKGSVITPGFVEVNASAYGPQGIFEDSFGMHWIRKGITSVIVGSDGVTPAPLFARSAAFLQSEYPRAFNADWQSVREFLGALERRGTGVNVGTFAGYATLRSAMTEGYGRDLTVGEIESLGRTIAESLKGGALGVSFDLSGLYLNRVSSDELFRVVNAAGRFKSVLAFHLRDERRPVESLAEILSFSEAHAANVEIGHFQPLAAFKSGYLDAASEIEKNSADKNIHFDVFPNPVARVSMHDLFPVWIKENTLSRLAEAMKEAHVRERVLEAFAGFGAGTLTIAVAPKPLKFLEGKTIGDFASNRGVSVAEALLTLATLSKMRMEFFSSAVDREALEELLRNNHSIVTLDSWDAGEGAEPLLEKILSSEESVEKITGSPARKFGLQGRGFLKEGYYADIAVFKDGKPLSVFVNGVAVLEAGIPHPELAGRVLKNKSEK